MSVKFTHSAKPVALLPPDNQTNFKGMLKEHIDAHPELPLPSYRTYRISEENVKPVHKCVLSIGSKTYTGKATTKKGAEQQAARAAMGAINNNTFLPKEASLAKVPSCKSGNLTGPLIICELTVKLAKSWSRVNADLKRLGLLNGQLLEKQSTVHLRKTLSPDIVVAAHKNDLLNLIYFHMGAALYRDRATEIWICSHSLFTSPAHKERIKSLDQDNRVTVLDTIET